MKVTELREITDALSRFATTREKNTGPTSRIGVQVSSGVMKMVSGNQTSGIIVTVQPAEGKYNFTFEARSFLQAAKILPAKDTVELEPSAAGLTMKTAAGGGLKLVPNGVLQDAGFAKKPKAHRGSAKVPSNEWHHLSRIIKEVSDDLVFPSLHIVGDKLDISIVAPGGMHPRYATCALDIIEGEDEYFCGSYNDFWEALKPFKEDGVLYLGRDGVLAKSGRLEAYCGQYLVSKYDANTGTSESPREPEPWPVLRTSGSMATSFTIDRKALLAVVKGQAPYDSENRVTLEVTSGSLVVRPYGSEAEQRVPASTVGSGVKSVRADYLGGYLSTMDCKEVTVGWHERAKAIVVTGDGYERWTLLVAPTAIR